MSVRSLFRPLLVVAVFGFVASGVVVAGEDCNCRGVRRPTNAVYAPAPGQPIIRTTTARVVQPAAPAPAVNPVYTQPLYESAGTSAVRRAGSTYYSTGIVNYNDHNEDYLIPTQHGLMEGNYIPADNPVDQYYRTHRVVNGRVVQVPME